MTVVLFLLEESVFFGTAEKYRLLHNVMPGHSDLKEESLTPGVSAASTHDCPDIRDDVLLPLFDVRRFSGRYFTSTFDIRYLKNRRISNIERRM
jgi:hypothetical protein